MHVVPSVLFGILSINCWRVASPTIVRLLKIVADVLQKTHVLIHYYHIIFIDY